MKFDLWCVSIEAPDNTLPSESDLQTLIQKGVTEALGKAFQVQGKDPSKELARIKVDVGKVF